MDRIDSTIAEGSSRKLGAEGAAEAAGLPMALEVISSSAFE